jgi:PIN domain nuclease of toxin-antitoxin system
LSKQARTLIENPENEKYISIASFWEIAIKNSFQILPITFEDTLQLSTLPFHHRDPFDRIVISQAKENNLMLLSCDSNLVRMM